MKGEVVVLNKKRKFLILQTLARNRPIASLAQVAKDSEPLHVGDWCEFTEILTRDGRRLAMNIEKVRKHERDRN